MPEAESTVEALRVGGGNDRIPRLFLHYFDAHFLEEKGVGGFESAAMGEMRLATRFSVMMADEVLVPAASHSESPLCRAVLHEFGEDIFHSVFRLVGSGANFGEFKEEKLKQYPAEQPQGRIYRQASSELTFPWLERERSATRDISTDWLAALKSGEAERVLKSGGQFAARHGEKAWATVPERLEGAAFIPENVYAILGADGVPLTTENRIRHFINRSYWGSYAADISASVVQDLDWLASPAPVASGDRSLDIHFRQLRIATLREGILAEIDNVPAIDLLRLGGDERFAVAVMASRGGNREAARRAFYTGPPLGQAKRQKRLAREVALAAKILIVTALPKEAAAIAAVMDEVQNFSLPNDPLIYQLGTFRPESDPENERSAIIVTQPGMGTNNAAAITSNALRSFPDVEHIVMVGIAGGCPNPAKPEEHVRLGDVVFSNETGVLAYDFIKETDSSREIRSFPQKPSAKLLQAAKLLEAASARSRRPWMTHLERGLSKLQTEYARPADELDILYDASHLVLHPEGGGRLKAEPHIHGGGIAAADTLQKDPAQRDFLRDEYGMRAIEMEASGIQSAAWIHNRDIFVIRGICDYCDEHKNDVWQKYAALAAASYARALLEELPNDWF
jgi:nucleoside phosphorylase